MELANRLIHTAAGWLSILGTFLEDHSGAITAIATAFIGFFTYILYKATSQLRAIAKRQAEALTDLERPWLFMEASRVERRDGAPIDPQLPHNWYISFIWRNVGRTPAVIEDCVIKIEPTELLPEIPDYTNASELVCPSTVAKDDEFETSQVGPGEEKRTKDGKAICLTIYGRLTYKQLSGRVHHTGFALDVSPNLPAASGHRNKKYEYYD